MSATTQVKSYRRGILVKRTVLETQTIVNALKSFNRESQKRILEAAAILLGLTF